MGKTIRASEHSRQRYYPKYTRYDSYNYHIRRHQIKRNIIHQNYDIPPLEYTNKSSSRRWISIKTNYKINSSAEYISI